MDENEREAEKGRHEGKKRGGKGSHCVAKNLSLILSVYGSLEAAARGTIIA